MNHHNCMVFSFTLIAPSMHDQFTATTHYSGQPVLASSPS